MKDATHSTENLDTKEQLRVLARELDRLKVNMQVLFDRSKPDERGLAHGAALGTKYLGAGSDGWINADHGGASFDLPAALKVTHISTSGSQDEVRPLEGINASSTFKVQAGNIVATATRYSDLIVRVTGGANHQEWNTTYDLRVSIDYKDNGVDKSAGPFYAKVERSPIPNGTYDLHIADHLHPGGAGYGPYATVWFRIELRDMDRYLHCGAVSLGCLTCAPSFWPAIYKIVNYARSSNMFVGKVVKS